MTGEPQQLGTCLNARHRLEAELGRGGMGLVYRATDTVLDRPAAVKVLSSAALGTPGRARLLNEARAVARLNHPHIVEVYDAGETDGQLRLAYHRIRLVADNPQDEALRRSWLENVRVNREIVADWETQKPGLA